VVVVVYGVLDKVYVAPSTYFDCCVHWACSIPHYLWGMGNCNLLILISKINSYTSV